MTVMPEPPPLVEVGRDRIFAGCLRDVPVVRGPDVAGRVNGRVGDHLDAAALEDMDDIAGLRARRMALSVAPGHERTQWPHMLPTQTSSLPSTFKPHGMLRLAGETHRRGLGAIGADHVDGAGGRAAAP